MSDFICKECGKTYKKRMISCIECGGKVVSGEEIGDTKEEIKQKSLILGKKIEFFDFKNAEETQYERYDLGIQQLNDLFGGGLTKGSACLFTGDPGNGKSTLFTQIASLINLSGKIAYFSGEESEIQCFNRVKRLGLEDKLKDKLLLKYSGNLEFILGAIEKENIEILIIDSVQTLYSEEVGGSPGNKAQIDYCVSQIIKATKSKGITLLMAVQITKGGVIAGPKSLEHAGDTTIYIQKEEFEGKQIRLFKVEKNRFGSTESVSTAEMTGSGFVFISQEEASKLFIQDCDIKSNDNGFCFSVIMEGESPFFVEVQAITSMSTFPNPTRRANGYSLDRLHQLIAVLDKFGLSLTGSDVFVNIVGKSNSYNSDFLDLAVAIALISSKEKKNLGKDIIAFGEVGLRGEIRNVRYKEVIEKFIDSSNFNKTYSKGKGYKHIEELVNELVEN